MPPPHSHPLPQSGQLVLSPVAKGTPKVRQWYLTNPTKNPKPCISSSSFIPREMVAHLMRHKKNLALGVKWESFQKPPDKITNMEGVLHTYVCPVVTAFMHGDYRYDHGHGVVKFGADEKSGVWLARQVIVSCFIHADFEFENMMALASCLSEHEVQGEKHLPDFITGMEKEGTKSRTTYDKRIKQFLIYHLTSDRKFPALKTVHALRVNRTIEMLEECIHKHRTDTSLEGKFVIIPGGRVLSLEFLFNSAGEQIDNEFAALEKCCPQGYNYTFDPPAIFAKTLDAQVINRIHCLALMRHASSHSEGLQRLRCFAFNDYADPDALPLFVTAFRPLPDVVVLSKRALFHGHKGMYSPPSWMMGAMLVLHNNSDAFGQNIEFEPDGMSMDGTIGANSSAAASLVRDRQDLLDDLIFN